MGIHAFLGAFLAGVALGGGGPEHKEAHDVVGRFVFSAFAPISCISMGMRTNVVAN